MYLPSTSDDDKEDKAIGNPPTENSWWGALPSWLQSAKEKSSTALEYMKRDIAELSQVVQTDAVAAVSSTAAILREKLKVDEVQTAARESVSSIVSAITDVFTPMKEIEDEENTEVIMIKDSQPVILDWWQAQLYIIRKDPRTYCREPEGPPEEYENWLESFDIHEYHVDIVDLLYKCPEIQKLYEELVPLAVSHIEFWQRYFYRVHLLKRSAAKKAAVESLNDESPKDMNHNKDSIMLQRSEGHNNSPMDSSSSANIDKGSLLSMGGDILSETAKTETCVQNNNTPDMQTLPDLNSRTINDSKGRHDAIDGKCASKIQANDHDNKEKKSGNDSITELASDYNDSKETCSPGDIVIPSNA